VCGVVESAGSALVKADNTQIQVALNLYAARAGALIFQHLSSYATALQIFDFAWDDQLEMWIGVGENTGAVTNTQRSITGGIIWTTSGVVAKALDLYGVASSGSSLFVAVGEADGGDAQIQSSVDGLNWTERANPKAFQLNAIEYDGSGLFCAVGVADGTDAYIVTSPDGTTWTERANPKNFDLRSVAYDTVNSLWCAVGVSDGSDSYVVTSPDGSTWTERSSMQNNQLNSVAHDGIGRWVAVGEGDAIITSADGVTWATASSPVTAGFDVVIFEPASRIWIAAGDTAGSSHMIASLDGVTWVEVSNTIAASNALVSNGKEIMASDIYDNIYRSCVGIAQLA